MNVCGSRSLRQPPALIEPAARGCSCPVPRSREMALHANSCNAGYAVAGTFSSFVNDRGLSQGPYAHVGEKSRRIYHRRHREAYVLAFSPLFRVAPCFESDIALCYVFTRVFARRWK